MSISFYGETIADSTIQVLKHSSLKKAKLKYLYFYQINLWEKIHCYAFIAIKIIKCAQIPIRCEIFTVRKSLPAIDWKYSQTAF